MAGCRNAECECYRAEMRVTSIRHPRATFSCTQCGDRCDHTVTPVGDDATPSAFTLLKVCHGSCAETSTLLSADAAAQLTGQSYDGATGRWTPLASSSVVGWVP